MHYSDPTHALLAKIAKSVDRLSETIEKQPHAEGSLLASTLAENIRLKESVQRLGEELLVIRMDATKDPALIAAIKDSILHPRK
jgi:hypothetical protein